MGLHFVLSMELLMKTLSLFSLLISLQFYTTEAHAFLGHDTFKVEQVKPWGEFGFRAQGKGMNISEMRLDCSQTSEMGLRVSVVNNYGKTSHVVLPAGQLGADKKKCQETLKKYFAGLYSKRGLASSKDKAKRRSMEVNFGEGKKLISFR